MEIPPEIGRVVPSILGSFSAAIISIVQDPVKWRAALVLILPGIALSYYAMGHTAKLFGFSEPLAGYFLGLLSMATASKLLGTINKLDLDGIFGSWLRKLLGLKEKEL